MKSFTRFLLLTVAILATTFGLKAQVSLYSYSESIGPYTPITGGAVFQSTVSSTLDDVPITGITLPFPFVYNGLPQTGISINPNGFIYFSSAVSYSSTPVSAVVNSIAAYARDLIGRQFVTASMTSGNPVITVTAGSTAGMQVGDAVFGTGIPTGATITSLTATTVTMSLPATSSGSGRNFRAANGSIRYETIGSAPNRKFVVQWSNFSRYTTTLPSDRLNFQIILEESTNIIRTSYNITYVHVDHTIQAGLAGASNADFNHRTGNFNTTILAPANSSTVNSQSSAYPTIGRTFSWTPPPFPTVTFSSVTPSTISCTSTGSRVVEVNASIASGSLTSVVLNYSFNGVAQTPVAMTNTSGSLFTATIPAATPANAIVTWNVLATSSFTTTASITGTAYQDQPLLGVASLATSNLSTVCSGSSSSLSAALNWNTLASTAQPTYTNPSVSSATVDEDLGNVTISQGATVILNNTSAVNTLTGTLGTATGTAGSYSNFTALGTYTLNAGQTYSISLSSITAGTGSYSNYMAAFLDINRDGSFTANEAIFVSPAAGSGAHTVTGTFTIPSSAFNGLMRLRVFAYETSPPSTAYVNSFSWGEFEDYLIDMVSTTAGGGSGTLPAITSVSWSDGTATVGTGNPLVVTPTVTTTYTGTVTAGGCQVTSSTITVNALPLPAAPIATNSTQCGTAVPSAFVTSAAGSAGTGDYNWFDAATNGNLVQNSSWLTQINENFNGATVAANGVLSGNASLTATPGWMQLTTNQNSQQGGFTVQPGVNGIQYQIDFDYKTNSTFNVADGFSWSFAPDADATLSIGSPKAESGTGSKLKISFDAYGSTMPNQTGTYLVYNNTDTTFTNTSAGVLAHTATTPWLSTTSKHITITISQAGVLNMTVDGVPVFTNIALPASYLTENKSTWKHVFAARTGGVNMKNEIDNLVIQYKLAPVGSTTFNSPLSSGVTYYVTELGANGCYSPLAPVVIGVSQPAAVTYNNSASAICIGESVTLNMSANITPAYTFTITSPNAGAGVGTSATGASQTFTPTASGSIPYIVTAANGNCTDVDTVVINVVPTASPAPIIAMDTLNLCPSATSASFTATPSAMTVPYTFNLLDSWGDGWNGNALNVLANGVLVESLTFTTGTSSTVTLNIPEGSAVTTQWTEGSFLNECSFNIVLNGATIHSASGLTTSNLASNMYSGTAPSNTYTFNWYSASTGGTLLGTGATFEALGTTVLPNLNTVGQYIVYAKQSNACLSVATPAVVNVTNVLAQINPVAATCNSVANGTFTLGTITCGTTPFTYSVDGGSFGAIPTNLAYGSHTVVVKDATGAVAPAATIFIDQPTWITNVPNFVANGWACKDETSEIISAANPNFTISTTIPLGSVSIVQAQTIVLNPALNLPVGAVITGATLSLNGMTTTGGSWANEYNIVVSGLGTLNTFPTGFGVTNANYSFPLGNINPNGTTINVSITNTWNGGAGVINNVSLVVNYTINQTLSGITWYATPTGGSALGSGYTLQTVGTSVLPNTTVPGTYNFYAQGELNGCSSFTRQLVPVTIQAPTVIANMQTATVCPGQFLTLSATGGLSYSWSNGAGQNTPFVPAPVSYVAGSQSYVVNGFDVDGCANQDTVVVTILPQPIFNAGFDQAVCAGTPVILNGSTTQQTATAVTSILWSNGIANNTQFVPTASGVLTATATGANGCTTQDQVAITVLALPSVNAGIDQTICSGTGVTLSATGAASYSWNNGINQGITFYPTVSQIYTVTGVGANGCVNQDQVQVNISTGPAVTVSAPQTVCANTSAAFSAFPQNALGGYWSTNGSGTIVPNISSTAINYIPSVNDPQVVTLTYVATNACGNASNATTVNVLALPTLNAGVDQAVCEGSTVVLNAASNGSVTWLAPNVNNGVAFVPASTATYTAVATGANNCTIQDQLVVTVLPLPDVSAGADVTICSGSDVILVGAGAVDYTWDNGVSNGVSFIPNATSLYTVTGTATNGCSSSDQVLVTVNATPQAVATILNSNTLEATPAGMNYQWINCTSGTDVPNASFVTFNALENGTYAVIVTSLEGCSDQSDCITLDAVSVNQITEIVMSVQPNPTSGDLNISMPSDLTASAQVFDAQGKLVIDQTNVSNGSILNLMNMTTGVYMVRITADDSVQTFRVVKQ